jgi:hypothetical protein
MSAAIPTVRKAFLVFLALWGFCYALYYTSQPVGFYSDSLHLLRVYSPSELRHTWTGNWDPDGIENPGFRPLSTLYFHVSSLLFGESALAHRNALITLWSLTATGVVILMSLLGVPPMIGILACWIWMVNPYNAYHVAWLSDGVHIFQAALAIPAGVFWILAGRAPSKGKKTILWLTGMLFAIAAILTRDDSLGMVAVVASLPALDAFISGARWSIVWKRLFTNAAWLGVVTALFFGYRHWALRGITTHYAIHPGQLVYGILRLDPDYFTYALWNRILGVGFFSILFITLWKNRSPKSLWVSLYFVLAVLISSIHMMVVARVNLLIFPSLIISIGIAVGLWRVLEENRRAFYLCAMCVSLTFLLAMKENRYQQELFLPFSLETLRYDIGLLYGEYADVGRPTISKVRREAILTKLNSVGLHQLPTLREDFNALAERCQTQGAEEIGNVICVPDVHLPEQFRLVPQFSN